MKSQITLAIIIYSLSTNLFAQNPSDDYFPLAVGNSWTYTYSTSTWEQLGDYSTSDSGQAIYKIVSQVPAFDSIVWNIRETRDVKHHYRNYFPPITDTTYMIKDSTAFVIIEYLKNNHPLISRATNWGTVFNFTSERCDSISLFRYYPSVSKDTFSTILPYAHLGYLIEKTQISIQRRIGIVSVAYSAPGVTGVVPVSSHILKSSFITSVDNDEISSLPRDFLLYQNYPNPFNPITSINFYNPVYSNIKLSIYDVLGQLVETIFDENIQAGKHFVQWNAIHYSSGIYFCVAKFGNQTKAIRLILLK